MKDRKVPIGHLMREYEPHEPHWSWFLIKMALGAVALCAAFVAGGNFERQRAEWQAEQRRAEQLMHEIAAVQCRIDRLMLLHAENGVPW